MTHDELKQRIANKDEGAFNYMYDMYAKSLFAVISNLVRDHAVAEAALHETFEKIWKTIDSYKESKGLFFAWMVGIARKTSSEHLKSKGSHSDKKDYTTTSFVHLHDEGVKIPDRIDAIGTREFIKKLKPKCIQIIELLYFRGLSVQDASEILEIPVGTVKVQNRNCINDLRKYLEN